MADEICDRKKSYDLVLREEDHTYLLNSRPVPSVTQIIRAVFPSWQVDPWYLDRGTQTHKACELYDLGTLDPSTLDRHIVKRVAAWAKFRKQYPGKVEKIELMLGDPDLMFAGKIDRIFSVDDWWVVLDLKNSISPQVFVQLGGYSLLWRKEQNPLRKTKGMAVELQESGEYRCQPMTDRDLRRAEQTFLAALTIHNFMKDNGMPTERNQYAHSLPQEIGVGHHSDAEW
jgi:hypothetical protein